ncbi:MAG TPA: hypothetical protein VJR29_11920 [bacterium]|nr:hypothetical protein [bacterium]
MIAAPANSWPTEGSWLEAGRSARLLSAKAGTSAAKPKLEAAKRGPTARNKAEDPKRPRAKVRVREKTEVPSIIGAMTLGSKASLVKRLRRNSARGPKAP